MNIYTFVAYLEGFFVIYRTLSVYNNVTRLIVKFISFEFKLAYAIKFTISSSCPTCNLEKFLTLNILLQFELWTNNQGLLIFLKYFDMDILSIM